VLIDGGGGDLNLRTLLTKIQNWTHSSSYLILFLERSDRTDGAMYLKLSELLPYTFLNITRKFYAASVTKREVINGTQRLSKYPSYELSAGWCKFRKNVIKVATTSNFTPPFSVQAPSTLK